MKTAREKKGSLKTEQQKRNETTRQSDVREETQGFIRAGQKINKSLILAQDERWRRA